MDFFAGLFGVGLLTISVLLAYRWGVKPDRDEKKRRAQQAVAEERRRHLERARRRSAG
jgi:hypothetical protein